MPNRFKAHSTNEYTVFNSASFVSDLKQFDGNSSNLYMTSFDIESLYTNCLLYTSDAADDTPCVGGTVAR